GCHTLSLHDALPICSPESLPFVGAAPVKERASTGVRRFSCPICNWTSTPRIEVHGKGSAATCVRPNFVNDSRIWLAAAVSPSVRSEEHTSELQPRSD